MRQMFAPVLGSQVHSLWQAELVKAGRGLDVAESSDSGENHCHLLLHSHTCSHSCPQCAGCLAENSEQVFVEDEFNSEAAESEIQKGRSH